MAAARAPEYLASVAVPLTAALGNVQLLLDDPELRDESVRQALQVVESQLRRLTEILRRLQQVRVDPPGAEGQLVK